MGGVDNGVGVFCCVGCYSVLELGVAYVYLGRGGRGVSLPMNLVGFWWGT